MKNIIFIISCFLFTGLVAQEKAPTDIISGELIVKLERDQSIENVCSKYSQFKRQNINFRPVRQLSRSANIWLVSYDFNKANQVEFLSTLRSDPMVSLAQFNHNKLKRRATPNDNQFGTMWGLNNTGQSGGTVDADIDATEAWDISTGGTTAEGDEIVVAVVDGGFQTNHPDLINNMWVNTDEIPGNNIDDDNNGYIDDINGWDAYQNDGTLPSDNHGTHVAGTVGADGNNGVGVTGVSWDVKVMMIAGSSTIESTVVAAYGYILDERTLYNQTNGAEGAFVVSTNASFGVDFGNPANFPIWCSMYDDLGAQGVISCGATANANTDVDAQGDVPTACPSPYLLSVTNTTRNDVKANGAAWGATTIDLGAPGSSVLSTLTGSTYGTNSGTSMATPHVAGAVGLMFAAACPDFIASYKNNPGAGALEIVQAIMDGTDPIPSLAQGGSTPVVSGGRLNVHKAILELSASGTGDCAPDFSLTASSTDPSICIPGNENLTIDVMSLAGYTGTVNLSVAGAPTGLTAALSPTVLSPTSSSTLSLSVSGSASPGTYTLVVTGTDGTNTHTANVEVQLLQGNPAVPSLISPANGSTNVSVIAPLQWQNQSDAANYEIEIATDSGFTNIIEANSNVSTNSYTPSNLVILTDYYWRVKAINVCGSSTFSNAFSFSTGADYCGSNGNDVSEEWIASVVIGTFTNTTANSAGGYADYSNLVIQGDIGATYSVTLTPGFAGTNYAEWWRIWVDLNNNGDFSDAGELLFDSGTASAAVQNGNITIPAGATPGNKRMRISMKYNAAPTPCETFTYGEVEDYTLEVIDPNTGSNCPPIINDTNVYDVTDGAVLLQASDYIVSQSSILTGGNVTMTASNYITLLPNFESADQMFFEARIEDCP